MKRLPTLSVKRGPSEIAIGEESTVVVALKPMIKMDLI